MATNQTVKTSLTLEERINVIKENQIEKTSQTDLDKKYNVSKAQIRTTIKRKVEYLKAYKELIPSKRCRIKENLKYPKIDKAVKEWFDLAQENNIPISGPIIQEKAKLIAETLGNCILYFILY
jgi:CRISPR/Cas system-associated protein Cas10 (large subunit of type III CRISPR-Cas system)